MRNYFDKKKAWNIAKDNKWIIAASVFFIILKFFLIGTLWENRLLPPQPDDAFIYASNIESVRDCPTVLCNDESQYYSLKNYQGFTYLTYRLSGGLIGKILHIDSISAFKLLFYAGTVLLLFSLIYLLKSLESNKNLIAISIFTLSLFNGMGYYHGFWWVVPSFFTVVLFFLILGTVFNRDDRHWKTKITIFSALLILTHPTGIFMNLSVPLLAFFCWFLKVDRKNPIFKKILFTFICSILIYSPIAVYLNNTPLKNPFGPENMLASYYNTLANKHPAAIDSQEEDRLSAEHNPPGKTGFENSQNTGGNLSDKEIVKNYYFSWIFFPRLYGAIPFILTILILFYYKKLEVLSIYFYFITLVVVGALFQNGSRMLILLWPFTYILIGFGAFFAFKLIRDKIGRGAIKAAAYTMIVSFLLAFTAINISFSYLFNESQNKMFNMDIDKDFVDYIQSTGYYKDNGKFVFFNSKLSLVFGIYQGIAISKITADASNAEYFVTTVCPDTAKETEQTKLFQLYSTLRKYISGFENRTGLDKREARVDCNGNLPSNFIFDKRFGDILIFKKT